MTDHPQDRKLGGRTVRLVVLGSFVPDHTVPAKRSECPVERPCRHIRCTAHLWVRPKAGRPGLARVPRNKRGLTLRVLGDMDPDGPPPGERHTLDPRWIEEPTPDSCMWDVIERHNGPLTNEQIGAYLARHRTLIAREVKRALRKLVAMGVTAEDLRRISDPDWRPEHVSKVTRR